MKHMRGFFAAIGVELPARAEDVAIRCFLEGHEDGSPSCSVNTDTDLWRCHGCDERRGDSGDDDPDPFAPLPPPRHIPGQLSLWGFEPRIGGRR
jgi:hypothetical protein